MKIAALTFTAALSLSASAWDYSAREIDRLGIYASLLGRAAACNIDTKNETRRVAEWIDRVSHDAKERSVRRILFALGLQQHAASQASGYSIESCAEIRRRYNVLDLP